LDEEEISESGKELVEELVQNPRQFNLLLDLFDSKRLHCEEFADSHAFTRPGLLSTETIVRIMHDFFLWYQEMWDIGVFAESLDFYLTSEVKNELQKQQVPEKEISAVIATLTTPLEESFSRKAEKSVLNIVKYIQQINLSFPDAFSDSQVEELMENHLENFYWITCNYFSFSGLGMENLKLLVESTASQPTLAKEKLIDLENEQIELEKKKQLLKMKYSLNEKVLLYFYWLEKVALVYDNRKKAQMYGFYSIGRMLKELTKRQKVPFDLAKYLFPPEIPDFVRGKIRIETLAQRRQYIFVDFNESPPLVLTGKEAREAEEKLWQSVTSSQNEVSGTCASPGKVVAKARVISSTKNLHELQQGEILVTGMTTPDYVPALGKAVGIITDDGGITCHAGIVSRELKIPCIVGTKLATRKIKTGDLLDLRAHHGMVRIVRKSAQ
jgi:phosphoenolpyruvate synthase/pyruvate phosphate dikinase